MAKLEQDIILWKNRFRVLQFTVSTEGVVDLDGYSAYWAISGDAGTSILLQKSTADDIELDELKVLISIYPEDLENIIAGTYYHELKLVDGENNPFQGAIGECLIKKVTING